MARTTGSRIEFEITKHIGVLSEGSKGWKTELNMVSWNKKPAKYDIRSWNPDHTQMGKGITLNNEELSELVRLGKSEIGQGE